MPQYQYKGRNQRGDVVKGYTEADNVEQLKVNLRKNGIWVTQAKIKIKSLGESSLFQRETITNAELILFTKQMGVMLSSKIPLLRALETYLDNASSRFKTILAKMIDEVKSGKAYAQVLNSYPGIFTPFYTGMIEIGETGGALGEMHHKIAAYLEQGSGLRGKILFASIYPCLVLGMTVIGVAIILIFAFPRIADVYMKSNVPLPLITQLLLKISDFMIHWWFFLLMLIISLVILVLVFRINQKPFMKSWLDKISLKIPLYGKLFQHVILFRFTYNMALLVNSGISLVKSLETVLSTINNQVVEGYLEELSQSIKKGAGMANYLQQNKFFPPLLVAMVRTGEESGELVKMINDAAKFYEIDIEKRIASFIAVIEPVLIICAAIVVIIVLLAFYLPMFKMFQTLH